ncbi:type VI secretion system ATPase TssH [Lampropedia aestuarii]|uniref:type VI secretion system ATPase TssH n=1 Tax=Lampropedia aestuarii TaxID=2562762 RepID=UPI0024684A6B|nr:type VI secretion system ATPase TssH [Lampropedia aestuarii]MDH5857392.1 type VI secretion system ATPase TssH [Lampropedia aestuarii]
MAKINRVSLFGKLNPVLYKAIESATVFAKLRGNPVVELGHWLYQLVLMDDCDLHHIARHYHLDGGKLSNDLLQVLERLPNGALAIEDLSGDIDLATERAWIQASLVDGASAVRSGHLLIALLNHKALRQTTLHLSKQWAQIDVEDLQAHFASIVAKSPESALGTAAHGEAAPGQASGAMSAPALGKKEALNKYTVDLTEKAAQGELDAVTGRDEEIRQLIDILMRRRQNNPILTGEAGVGKTAVVEGFALRIAEGDVPPALQGVQLRVLDIGLLQAGASMKGEFEQRLRQLIEEVQHAEPPIILFIDEVHTLVGAGGAAGTGDAANLLKPALARGTLRTIGATTWAEYKKYIEKDPALTRRFQVVQVAEPDEAKAIAMLRGIATPLQQHHGVRVLDSAIRAAVSLSHRYIPARQLPDKAVALLDTAAARVAVSQHTTPAALEDCKRKLHILDHELHMLQQEQAAGIANTLRIQDIENQLQQGAAQEAELTERWAQEKELIAQIVQLRDRLAGSVVKNAAAAQAASTEAADSSSAEAVADEDGQAGTAESEPLSQAQMLQQVQSLEQQLQGIRGEDSMVYAAVDEQVIAAVVADWTGIPVGRMLRNEAQAVLELAENLERRVIGQRHGLEAIARRIQTSRAKLDNPVKPIGVFMLCGPSGVGKTETALALAEFLYGGEQNLITINMSEFQEAHTVSTLKGAPPGYVGYGEGGILTEAVRRRPYSVVLLDEVEKAHTDVHEIFFQVFDKGRMEDGEGREIDFRNTVIILTSNVGTDVVNSLCADPELIPQIQAIDEALRKPLLEVFPPALLGRLITVPYLPLSPDTLANIVRLQFERIRARVAAAHNAEFVYDQSAIDLVMARCNVSDAGGRMIDAVLTNSVLPEISRKHLSGVMQGQGLARVAIKAEAGEFIYDFVMRALEPAAADPRLLADVLANPGDAADAKVPPAANPDHATTKEQHSHGA